MKKNTIDRKRPQSRFGKTKRHVIDYSFSPSERTRYSITGDELPARTIRAALEGCIQKTSGFSNKLARLRPANKFDKYAVVVELHYNDWLKLRDVGLDKACHELLRQFIEGIGSTVSLETEHYSIKLLLTEWSGEWDYDDLAQSKKITHSGEMQPEQPNSQAELRAPKTDRSPLALAISTLETINSSFDSFQADIKSKLQSHLNEIRKSLPKGKKCHFGSLEKNVKFARQLSDLLVKLGFRLSCPDGGAGLLQCVPGPTTPTGRFRISYSKNGKTQNTNDIVYLPKLKIVNAPPDPRRIPRK